MNSIIFLIFVLLLLSFIFSVSASQKRTGGYTRRPRARARRDKSMTQAASQAMQRAGYHVGDQYTQVTDIGLLAYRNSEEPKMVRYGDVVIDTQYLRPFAELWLPYAANGTVRFEIADTRGRLRYADESRYELQRGKNTLLPSTWLPLQGKAIEPGDWQLNISAGQTLLARYIFGWQELGGGEIQRYAAADGEISPELQQALQGKSRESISLSDLLSEQEE